MEKLGIQNKIAIITGASSGIGKATAFKFASENVKLMLVARDEERLKIITNDIKREHDNVNYFAADCLY